MSDVKETKKGDEGTDMRATSASESLNTHEEKLDIQADDAVRLNNRGNALANLGRYSEALKKFEEKLKPNNLPKKTERENELSEKIEEKLPKP